MIAGPDSVGNTATVTPSAFLVLDDVTTRFGTLTAVGEVSLTIEEGELICFLGPSGCGKTTRLRLIPGLEYPDASTIALADHDLANSSARERNFGMVFQQRRSG